MSSFNNTLLPVPLRPSTLMVSPSSTVRSIPSSTVCSPNDLCRFFSPICAMKSSRKENNNQPDQHYVRQDDEQRRKQHGAGSGSSHAFGAAAGAHALK